MRRGRGDVVKRAWPILTLGLAFGLSAAANADTYTVLVTSNPGAFTPADVTINVGDKVVWAFISGAHTVTSDFFPNAYPNGTPAFDSGLHSNPYRFRRPFNIVGDHWYYCILHGSPGGFGHAGVIRVVSRHWDDDDEWPMPEPTPVRRP